MDKSNIDNIRRATEMDFTIKSGVTKMNFNKITELLT